ncbi:hypothetical protein RsoM2USA_108 [Ralstonia phage RsoM2USA]|nr:hypothetical protein RsoM2USA_108 [Ralstonia phage RsoM2USA]
MSKPRFQKYTRKFLNKNKGTAAIEVTTEVWSDDVQCDVKITDCFRAITLDFNAWDVKKTPKNFNDHLHKFDTLIAVLQETREAFIKAGEVAKAYVPEERKKKTPKAIKAVNDDGLDHEDSDEE